MVKGNGGKKGKRNISNIYSGHEITVLTSHEDYENTFQMSRLYGNVMVKEGRAKWVNHNTIKILYSRRELMKLVLERDNYICQYCGKKGSTVDHIQPNKEGGLLTPENLVCCCEECNYIKGDFYITKKTKKESFDVAKQYINNQSVDWIVYCKRCDKAILKGQDRITKEYGSFCSQECLINYSD